ncbi:YdeI/OmpD-associated family protein [Salipiger thiooxidans]|nr:YdeI/OmpD-associated family protein [Salipiger thiooxidans]MBN8186555.1 YdeI/OmpD-associated family protein [Salipiger thiooxidans]
MSARGREERGEPVTDSTAKIEAFYAREDQWQAELALLREILTASPLSEEFKWRAPCYTWKGANVAMPHGFRDDCRLTFFKGVLLRDPEGLLVLPGDNSRSARLARFTSVDEIAAARPVLRAYIDEAIKLEEEGATVTFEKDDLDYPVELVAALDDDPELAAAFEALTPGRRRSWVLHLTQARQSATRVSRLKKARPKILAGKGLNDR